MTTKPRTLTSAVCTLAALVGLLAGGSCVATTESSACERLIRTNNPQAEIIIDGRTVDFDPCVDSIPHNHYAWMRDNERPKVSITLFNPGGGELPITKIEYALDYGATVDSAGTIWPDPGTHEAKLVVRLNDTYFSNFLYVSILDSIRTYSIPSVGGTWDFLPPTGTTEDWNIRGTLTLADTGGLLRYVSCVDYSAEHVPSPPCTPEAPRREFAASFVGTICEHPGSSCTDYQQAGRASIDTLGVDICLGTGLLSSRQMTGCYVAAYGAELTVKKDSLSGNLVENKCAGSAGCGNGRVLLVRRP